MSSPANSTYANRPPRCLRSTHPLAKEEDANEDEVLEDDSNELEELVMEEAGWSLKNPGMAKWYCIMWQYGSV